MSEVGSIAVCAKSPDGEAPRTSLRRIAALSPMRSLEEVLVEERH
jgi:hypothetical protein